MSKDRLYLDSIRECLDRIAAYTAEGEATFLDSTLIQDGVIRNLISSSLASIDPWSSPLCWYKP